MQHLNRLNHLKRNTVLVVEATGQLFEPVGISLKMPIVFQMRQII